MWQLNCLLSTIAMQMATLGVVTVVLVSALFSFSVNGLECPAAFSSLESDHPGALSNTSVNLYLDEMDFQGGQR